MSRAAAKSIPPLPPPANTEPTELRPAAILGRVVCVGTDGEILVDFPGNRRGPTRARRIGVIPDEALCQAAGRPSGVVLVFEDGDPSLPLVLSLCSTPAAERPPALASNNAPLEARLDGRRVVLEGHERIELRCGGAAIELCADGTIKLRGRDIKSLARRRQRITGGSVDIN
ncbi:hypothetical protein ENSA5_19650 [Enhygromyxa salina]|uniref:DUF6484 domain-containing protein n=1 Tax=Enhygromyxa salina TaxID=215803 RepID=A0A2S9YDD3_9BACT|nr:DUF6484 domain-containing protein [Enhygromyxa salina]PRQ03026.1 hypothetical protein ENSA5_19650 [Enhygromyxa salina]